MKKLHLLGICLLAIAASPINSCRKVDEMKYLLENGRADLKQCTIDQMSQLLGSEPVSLNLTFAYNNRRDPVSIIVDLPTAPVYTQWLFYYDKKGRLSQSVTLHYDGTFERWHVYLYDDRDRIMVDSNYDRGQAGDRSTALGKWQTTLYYDHLDRIIKEVSPYLNSIIDYTYNNQGNLTSIRRGNADVETLGGYVNEGNVLLTNHVWRFLARNYSVNSRAHAYSLNDHGLATDYTGMDGRDLGYFFFGGYNDINIYITYNCQDAPGIAK